MLTAQTGNGRMISLIENWDKNELQKLTQTEALFCPVCKERVLIKKGNKRIWHFAHNSKLNCVVELENESEYHLKGKINLYHWFKNQGIPVELELYIPKIKQRPDLYVQVNGQGYAIEFQCSTMDSSILLKRTNSYLQEKIKPIWILGGNRLKKNSQNLFKLSPLDLLMTHCNNSNVIQLIYYCPSTNRFCIASSLTPFTSSSFLSNSSMFLPSEIQFSKILHSIENNQFFDFETWIKMKKRWRTKTFLFTQDYFRHWFYGKGMALCLLPGIVGIPTKSMIWINTEAILWQGWILQGFIIPLRKGEDLTFHHVYQAFKAEVRRGNFKLRQLPALKNSHYSFAIMEYLQKLAELGILRKSGNPVNFQKLENPVIPKTIEEACMQDREVLKRIVIEQK